MKVNQFFQTSPILIKADP